MAASDEKQHPSARYCVGDVAGERGDCDALVRAATSKKELLAAMPRTMAFCHPEVEWSAPEDGTTYRGREGVRQRLEEWLESFDDYRYEVQRIIDCGGDEVWSRRPRWAAAQ